MDRIEEEKSANKQMIRQERQLNAQEPGGADCLSPPATQETLSLLECYL
jgi:hypothetical protein